ncbi:MULTISPECIES: formimidoylglutamate deiminase [Agrobacterium]|uniref:Formimidoylglutamate deiminase n=1 Tax=Agrobacterium rosae TaxID=1972867 RepID=A0AAE5VNT1_9HYPH|nr:MULTISPECIES: formimidoylglutamate deiminase [Agrobacterium]KAA3515744.1 formimidoylglutamate deiminase [Agrobacterium rosae]KAA3524704.1 formimidoylglutamate deiminase [Agrobacterium rosae]MBN7803957.1 formimidoylglutamate deiminase [Agrobacterium rosae]MCM2431651.1 formimidoylglutamate deiminase [Agrobacterium rosae]MDX8312351.1 formimidoylglutamate deiminase [Agrobacterium rosae]
MNAIHAKSALLTTGWARDVRLEIEGGLICSLTVGTQPQPGDERTSVLVPAMPNLHSHAFQRAMAGLAEIRGPADDSFWSWRTVMYRFALSMTPDHVEAVAAQLYMEMLEAGYCRVGEFHYLHNDKDGAHYANIAEMAERIGAASTATGIGLTLLPVFYAHSGFGGQPPIDGQRRFIHSVESYGRVMEGAAKVLADLPGGVLGIAPHSLRAVTDQQLDEILPLAAGGPVHIHVAEQVKEVEDCVAWSGARPVEWLLDHAPVDDRWCLIHATHMTEDETRRMAQSGAVAGLCPITEANLGDGVFPAPSFLAEGGRYGIGSDSNILTSVAQELRMLEYSQRLALRARNVVADAGGSTGRKLFEQARLGGNAALQAKSGLIEGGGADIVSLDTSAVPYLSEDQLLDHWIFAGGVAVDAVWSAGRKQVQAGRHIHRAEISGRFNAAMADLLTR